MNRRNIGCRVNAGAAGPRKTVQALAVVAAATVSLSACSGSASHHQVATGSPSSTPTTPVGAADVPTTPALRQQLIDSYYQAYQRDPNPVRDFGQRAGEPKTAVILEGVSHFGVIYQGGSNRDVYWAVAAICLRTATACQDAGAYQVFHRSGTTGPFTYSAFAPCLIPKALFERWFASGPPLGTRCPPNSASG